MIQVETTAEELVVRIPHGEVDDRAVQEWLAWLKLMSFTRHSQMTQEEADAMADEGKAEWWAANKHRFLPKELL
jgi:hypothetical protein